MVKIARTCLPFLLLGISYGCGGGRAELAADSPAKTPSPSTDTVSLPSGMNPTRLFTTTSPSLVIKAAGDIDHRSLYSWEPGQAPKLIIEGRDLDVTRLSDDTFAAWYSDNDQEAIVTLDAKHLISEPLNLPNGGPTGWQTCEGDTVYVICIGNRPGMNVDDKEYDELAFSAVLVIDLVQRTTTWFPVHHRTNFRLDLAHKVVYVIDWTDPSSRNSAVAFDLAGEDRGTAHFSEVMPLSPSGRFAESLEEDGLESWEVYEAASNKVLLAFNCDRPGCKEGERYEEHWNPIFTD